MLGAFWETLHQIQMVQSKDGHYLGTVSLEVFPGKKIFEERGLGPVGPFHNTLLFEKKGDRLLLAKKRPIYADWTELLVLVSSDEGYLETISPYVCGQDHYFARIVLENRGFSIHWKIKGPKKGEEIVYHYF
ncbi:MAG: DUF6314 family protein [Chlamydiota bacterium]